MWVLRFRYSGKGLAVPVEKPVLAVGRGDGNDVLLRVPGVSRRHCEFRLEGERPQELWVVDSGSQLGVLRGECRVERERLGEGDALQVGPVWVFVQREPTGDWRGRGEPHSVLPASLGMEASGPDTAIPERETVPLDFIEHCLDALSEGGDWGRKIVKILALSSLEITCETEQGKLCAFPKEGERCRGAEECVDFTSSRGRWLAVYAGGRPESRGVLRLLLRALDLRGAPAGRSGAKLAAPGGDHIRPTALGAAWDQVEPLVASDIPILIMGETGAGKEVLARAIHGAASEDGEPFEVIHCAAIPEALFESELFGIEPNTASGVSGKKGKLEAAHGGSILLDEVGEIPLAVQAKLLRILEDSAVVPIGARRGKPLKVRWLSATNRDLQQAVKEGRFREDLYFRLRGAEVTVTPLRERRSCIPELVEQFLGEFEGQGPKGLLGLSLEAYRACMSYLWPGNVRELKMELKRAYLLAEEGGLIRTTHLSPRIAVSGAVASSNGRSPLDRRTRPSEEGAIRDALARCDGNVTRAAAKLGITRQTLAKRMAEMGLSAEEFKERDKS